MRGNATYPDDEYGWAVSSQEHAFVLVRPMLAANELDRNKDNENSG